MLLIAVLFTTAQADYLGPNRVIVTYETIYQRQACRFVDVRDPAGPGVCACTMTVYVGPKDSCPGSVDSHYFHTDVCGWSSENPDCTDAGLDSISGPSSSIQSCSLGDQACTAVVIEHRTTLAAATVSGAITCSTPGQNGWCVGPAVLNASGSEPLSGYSILTLEGTRNGESFACPGASCSNVPLSEGSNDFQFWAISSYGDSSAMGSASASVDTQAPTISGSLSGTQGENGWYTSAVTLSAAATDPTPGSGIASFEVSADGAAWQPCSGSLTLGDGVHTVSLRTADAAGWTASAEQTFSVDTQAPQLSADLSGNLVSPGRYNTSVTLSTSGSDTGSGLNRIEYQDNAGGWTTYTDPLIFYNGQHEIEVRAVDQAGLTSDVQTFSFFVESRGPYITVPDHWQVGQTISVSVQANSFSLGSVSIVVSDPQKRWPDVEQVYPASGDSFTTDFHWDGRFNGQTAAAGQYTVSVYASDVMSNLSVSHSQVTIPVVIPTAVPTLTATGTAAAAESTTAAAATVTPQPSSTPTTVVAAVPVTSFSSPASPVQQPVATLPSNVLWGGAAAAVIGAATAAALEAARKRKEEEEAQRQAAEAAAAQFNAAEKVIDAQIAANQDSQWLMQQWLGSRGLPTSYPTQAALVAAYDAAREAEKKAKEQEAFNDAYLRFKQADQQSMQEYEAYQESLREADELKTEQQYIDYFASMNIDVAPGQLTLEQLRDMKAQYDGGLNTGIGQNPLLNLQQWESLPKDQQKTEFQITEANNENEEEGSGIIPKLIDFMVNGTKGVIDTLAVSKLKFTNLDSGYVGVSADTPPGTRLDYKQFVADQGFDFLGTRYLPETVVSNISKGLIEDSLGVESIALGFEVSFVSNGIKYGKGSKNVDEFIDRTVMNQEFWSSTLADTVVSIISGILAAAIVSVGLAIIGGTSVASVSLAVIVAATAVVGAIAGVVLDSLGVNNGIKSGIDTIINSIME